MTAYVIIAINNKMGRMMSKKIKIKKKKMNIDEYYL
jgi:hypothetical protein